jgi:spermidine synthase
MDMSRVRSTLASASNGEKKRPRPDGPAKAGLLNIDSRAVLNTPLSYIFPLLLFGSGAAGLIYQVLWVKQLSLVVGIEVYAVTTGISAFFAGLALGSFLFGRWVDRSPRPLFLYALLEVGVAVLGVATTIAFAHAANPFAAMEQQVGPFAWLPLFLLIGLPALLMGGTLPAVVRAVGPGQSEVGWAGGALYAANTAGAIAGALLTVFLLIRTFGVQGSAIFAAAINLTLGAAAFSIQRSASAKPLISTSIDPVTTPIPAQARFAIGMYAAAGGIALGYEVFWSQAIIQFMSTRSFAFAMVLAVYLSGLFAGSSLSARYANRFRDPWSTFGLLTAAAGCVALLEISLLGPWVQELQLQVGHLVFSMTGSLLADMSGRFFATAVAILFIPTLLLGAAFPIVLRLAVGADSVGRGVGSVLAANTIGGVLGTMLTGFFLIPRFGLVHTIGILAIAAAIVGAIATTRSPVRWKRMGIATLAVGACALVLALLTPKDRFASLLTEARGGNLVFYDESSGGTAAVLEYPHKSGNIRRLYIQGVSNSGDAMPSLRYMRLQSLLPLLIHKGEPHSALVIGFGTGITAGSLLAYPQLEKRVCAELLPAVVNAGPLFHGNFDAAHNLKIEIRLRDGRRELVQSPERYDLITLEPPPPSAAGVVNLYSRDFYELAGTRLQPNGLLAQWLPLSTQNVEETRSLVRSFLDAFPYATLWTTELHEMLLIGSLSPIELDLNQITARYSQPPVEQALRDVGIDSPAALLATFVTDRAGLVRFAANAPAVTDDRPRIEYAPWVRLDEITRTLPEMLALRTEPPLLHADGAFWRAEARELDLLQNFYTAGIAAYNRDKELWSRSIQHVMAEDGRNAYYRWVVGGG